MFSRVAADQATVMPLNMVVFLSWPHLWRGDVQGAADNVAAFFWPSVTFALSIWPFVHPLSFRFVPLEHRLLVLNVCSLFVFSYATFVSDKGSAGPSGDSVRGAATLKRTPTEHAAAVAAAS